MIRGKLLLALLIFPFLVGSGAATSLTADISGPVSANMGDTIELTITLTTDNLTDVAYDVTATDGDFFGNDTKVFSDIVSVNGTVVISYNWTAPTPILSDTDVVITLSASADTLTAEDSITISVKAIEGTMTVSADVNATELFQNESLQITAKATDGGNPLADVEVSMVSEIGKFPDGQVTYSGNTSADGTFSTILSFASDTLLFSSLNNSINITFSLAGYKDTSVVKSVIVKQVQPTVSFSAEVSTSSITQGEEVSITAKVLLDGAAWEGATVKLEADGGAFIIGGESKGNTVSVATSADGTVTVTWSTKDVPPVSSELKFTIKVSLVSADYSADPVEFTITAAPSAGGGTTTPTPFPLIGLVAIIIGRKKK